MADAGRVSRGGAVRVGILLGGGTSVVSTVAIGQVWAACDVGAGSAANSSTLLLLAPLFWFATAIPLAVLYGVVAGRHRRAALAAALLLAVCCAWFLVTWLGVLDSYPDPVCPGNVPPWWPEFIPAS
ncbi:MULTISPECIES: hypothetical protein [Streptomyces]|uniref:Integral membrane protein n=1 Tax=Streptomyces edwardsiae TaxID=3075527 RepID=A0ABU2PUX6_9ACTN|nr:hypothetical protein [Streptomyces sp. DSM 41636]MDT0395972.1 hypothetical protein [Streptomyces sp. DSM 41636]